MVEESEQIRRFLQLFSHSNALKENLEILASQKFSSLLNEQSIGEKNVENIWNKKFVKRFEDQLNNNENNIEEVFENEINKEMLKNDFIKLTKGNLIHEPLKKLLEEHKGARSRLIDLFFLDQVFVNEETDILNLTHIGM